MAKIRIFFIFITLMLISGIFAYSFDLDSTNSQKLNNSAKTELLAQSKFQLFDSVKTNVVEPSDTLFFLKKNIIPYSISKNVSKSSADLNKLISDSLTAKHFRDSIQLSKNKSGIDTIVTFSAKDTVKFNIKNKTMRLRGDAKVSYRKQKLESEVIILHFNESQMESHGVRDTSKKSPGYPKFTDAGESFVGEKINYNFKTKQGLVALGETEMSEGFYFGNKIKRVSESEMFVEDGCYTTCDKPHPHFYFGSSKMKIIAQDRILMDPLVFYVEDMPIFEIPFGLYFPNKTGRQSGLIIPSFFFSGNRGVTLENLGIYLALSDYYDTQFGANYYSKGGYTAKNFTQWKLLDVMDGNIDIQYGKTRLNPDEDYTTNWSLKLRHNQILTPQSQFVANLSFASQNFNRNTSPNINDRMQQEMSSNASYSRSFDNGSSLSLSYSRSQNIITNEYTQNPQLSFNLPSWFVLKPYVDPNSWMKDVTITYSGSSNYDMQKQLKYSQKKINDTTKTDTSFQYKYQSRISHNPGISISPKFGFFTISPSISLRANNYFRKMTRTFNSADSTTKDTTSNGFYTEYSYSAGVNLSTRLFGIIKPKLFGINALRHTFQPSVGFSYTPDQSDPSLGFYGSYYDLRQNRNIKYSRYERDGGGLASTQTSKSINYSIANNFGAKIAKGDTIQDLTIDLLSLALNGSYNMAADSLRCSDISMSFHTPAFGNLSLNGNAGFTVYDEAQTIDPATGLTTGNYTRINKFLIQQGHGLARLTSFGLNLSTNFSSSGISIGPIPSTTDTATTVIKDTVGLGERFRQRRDYVEKPFDFFGDNSPGFSRFSIPWTATVNLNYQYSQPSIRTKTEQITVNATLSFKITPTWSIDGTAQYDFTRHELLAPSFNIKKDMHCWELVMTWYPIGLNSGYYLRFGIKAQQLKDLKWEKRNNPIY